MKTSLLFILFISTLIYFTQESCTKDKTTNPTTSTCDSIPVSYATDIEPVLKSRCTSCHGGTSPNLETVDKVKAAIENSNLICTIEQTSCTGSKAMPQGSAKLADSIIQKFKTWKCKNYPN